MDDMLGVPKLQMEVSSDLVMLDFKCVKGIHVDFICITLMRLCGALKLVLGLHGLWCDEQICDLI